MKQTTKAAIAGASVALGASFFLLPLTTHQAAAADVGGGEQYKIIAAGGLHSSQELEQELNRLGADGWKVRAVMGLDVIVAK
jgi:hypothetical protein